MKQKTSLKNKNMETNKETRMISSDEIFYAVLKDGSVVSNFREAVESMAEEHAVGLVQKALDISYYLFEEARTFPATTADQARLLLIKAGVLALSRSKARREKLEAEAMAEAMAKVKAYAEKMSETADRKEDGGE